MGEKEKSVLNGFLEYGKGMRYSGKINQSVSDVENTRAKRTYKRK
ncbi:hypothetical protein [Desulfomarina profundi]|nr:hypothetical protein [Desulfomarina profundi]